MLKTGLPRKAQLQVLSARFEERSAACPSSRFPLSSLTLEELCLRNVLFAVLSQPPPRIDLFLLFASWAIVLNKVWQLVPEPLLCWLNWLVFLYLHVTIFFHWIRELLFLFFFFKLFNIIYPGNLEAGVNKAGNTGKEKYQKWILPFMTNIVFFFPLSFIDVK